MEDRDVNQSQMLKFLNRKNVHIRGTYKLS